MFFFWCLSMFGASRGLFFVFFWCLSMFLYISCQDHGEKSAFYWGFRPSKCNTSVFTVLSSFLMEIHYPMGCRPLILYRYLTNIQYVFIYICEYTINIYLYIVYIYSQSHGSYFLLPLLPRWHCWLQPGELRAVSAGMG